MDATGDPEEHLLWSFHDLPLHLQEVTVTQRLETEVVVGKVPAVVDQLIEFLPIGHNESVDVRSDDLSFLSRNWIGIPEEIIDDVRKLGRRRLVEVGNGNPRRQLSEVRVNGHEVGRRFGRQFVQFKGRDAVIDAVTDLLSYDNRIDILLVQVCTETGQTGRNLIKLDFLFRSVPFYDVHGCLELKRRKKKVDDQFLLSNLLPKVAG